MQFLCDQDREDFEQEKRIAEWLSRTQPGGTEQFDLKHINSKGNARNTLVRAQFSLDQTITKDDTGGGKFADLVGGFDGRSLEDGDDDYHFREHFEGTVWETLTCLGLNEGEIQCLIKMWRWSDDLNEMRLQTSMTDLEWESL